MVVVVPCEASRGDVIRSTSQEHFCSIPLQAHAVAPFWGTVCAYRITPVEDADQT